jgi:hypothetical protein
LGKNQENALIVGATATGQLQDEYSIVVRENGLFRFCKFGLPPVTSDVKRWQTFDSWLRIQERDVMSWTLTTIRDVMQRSSENAPFGTGEYDVLCASKDRYLWKSTHQIKVLSSEVHLCRSIMPGSSIKKEFWLATFVNREGVPHVEKSARIAPNDALRLTLGIAKCYGKPYKFEFTEAPTSCSAVFRGRLPYPEQYLLDLALRSEHPGFYWPTPLGNSICATVENLGVDIVHQQFEDRK